jgi:hypothetical protein
VSKQQKIRSLIANCFNDVHDNERLNQKEFEFPSGQVLDKSSVIKNIGMLTDPRAICVETMKHSLGMFIFSSPNKEHELPEFI